MIDVDTYRALPRADQVAIDEWLRLHLAGPEVERVTEIELANDGTCRVRHFKVDEHGNDVLEGDDLVDVDSVFDVAHQEPEVLATFGAGPELPSWDAVLERLRTVGI